MSNISEKLWLSSRIEEVLKNEGILWNSFHLLTSLPSSRLNRSAFRIDLKDGTRLKARKLPSSEHAQRVTVLREELPEGFARIKKRFGSILLEDWIEGTELGSSVRDLRDAGRLLFALHSNHSPTVESPDLWVEELLEGLKELQERGVEGAGVFRKLESLRPERATVTVIHHDFCAQNLVRDERGKVWSVDNEALCLGPIELDLARTRYRWQLSDTEEETLLSGYPKVESFLQDRPFWDALSLLRGTLARVRWQMSGVQESVDRLGRLAEGLF